MLRIFRAPIGVDLGSSAIKVVQIKGKKVSLAALMDIEDIREDELVLIERLRGFFKNLGISGKQAVVHIPGREAFIRTTTLPLMPKRELNEAVRWEIKRHLPYPPEEAIFDYVALKTADGIAVTFAASEKKNIHSHITPIKEAGLNVIAVDVSPLCLLRALKPKSPGNTVLLDMGAASTEISIVKNGILRITRTLEKGSHAIKKHFVNLSDEEAERLLREGSEEELKDPLYEFTRETFRSIDYYKANFKESTVSEVTLTGGIMINPAIGRYFSKMLDIPVSVPDPFEGLTLADEGIRKLGPRFSVAVGLARRHA